MFCVLNNVDVATRENLVLGLEILESKAVGFGGYLFGVEVVAHFYVVVFAGDFYDEFDGVAIQPIECY